MTDIKVSTQYGTGIATTSHASSSHGLPVVVVDGQAYGPADIGPINMPTYGEGDTNLIEAHAALERAGYEVYA